jgi:hypothetical protein
MKNKVGTPKNTSVNINELATSDICDNFLSKIVPNKAVNTSVLTLVKNLLGSFFATSNSLPSLVKNIVSLTKVVLVKYLTNKGTPRIVSQNIQVDQYENFCGDWLIPEIVKAIASPPDIPNQNTKFQKRSFVSHSSCFSWFKDLTLAITGLVKSSIIHSHRYINPHHNIIPKIRSIIKQMIITLSIIISFVLANTVQAATKPELLEIISNAEKEHNIPKGLLLAVAKTESNLEAYALNISGRPHFFKDKNIASQTIRRALDEGITNIDIGAAQINYKWHGHKFSSIEDMLSPEVNIHYAAKLLAKLKQQHGNWHKAIRIYHSSNLKYHRQYSRRVVLCWLGV